MIDNIKDINANDDSNDNDDKEDEKMIMLAELAQNMNETVYKNCKTISEHLYDSPHYAIMLHFRTINYMLYGLAFEIHKSENLTQHDVDKVVKILKNSRKNNDRLITLFTDETQKRFKGDAA